MFCHLHLHSQYSILESSITIEDLVQAACRQKMEAVALTDRNVMHGAIEFYSRARRAGLNPILGCQVYVRTEGVWSLVLLCKNEAGYRNLCRLVSRAHTQKKEPVPCLDPELITANSSHLFALGPVRQGQISVLLKQGKDSQARKALQFYRELFGSSFYLEVQRYPAGCMQAGCSEAIINFGLKNKVKLVATNDVHYLKQGHCSEYQAMYRLKSMATRIDPYLEPVEGDQHYFKTSGQMQSLFTDLPSAISNTRAIAASCKLDLKLGSLDLPRFKPPCSCSQAGYLKKLCCRGLEKRYRQPQASLYRRLDYELDTISDMGYSGYFLVVWDIARFARHHHIPICGKGSAAGSLVSYVLGISDVDPVKNNLYFERFLNRQRKQPPDVDMDIAHKDREKVIEYLQSRYGTKNVGRVCTFATIRPRAAIRETSRMLNYSKQETDQLLLDLRYEKNHTESGYRELGQLASKISSRIRHLSTHPSAVIVSNQDLEEKVPMMLSAEGKLMSQYDMDSIEALGILKIDLINSLSLTLIQQVTAMLKDENHNLDPNNIPGDDPRVFNLMARGATLGVFQLESTGIRSLMRKLRPTSIQDIALLLSLYRPGPQQSGMVKDLIQRKSGRQKVTYLHPDLKPILAETYGIIVYQEQVLRIARKIAGSSFSQADLLRRAITKRSKSRMQLLKQTFLNGARNRGYSPGTAGQIFGYISKFASYGFLKAHAAAYARLSYATCYLKAYYPAYFLSVILSNGSGYYPAAQYVQEARRLGIAIQAPCINGNGFRFIPRKKARSIRVPLITVKGLGPVTVNHIIEERRAGGDFKNFTDFCQRCLKQGKISKAAVQNLIKAGAFDFAASNRKRLLLYFWQEQKKEGQDMGLSLINDFCLEEKIKIETELLGFAAAASPLAYYRQQMKNLNTVDSSKFHHGNQVTAAGMVINRRIERTKNGEDMLFCTLEDEGGMYEVLFFPPAYHRYKRTVTGHKALVVKGRVNYRDGSLTVIAYKAWSLENLKKAGQNLKDNHIRNQLLEEAKPLWPNRLK